MKIKHKTTDKPSYGFWNRRFRGFSSITLQSGQVIKFKTNELASFAREQIFKRVFPNILDLVKFAKSLPTGFETETTIPMGTGVSLSNGLFIPAKRDSIVWDD